MNGYLLDTSVVSAFAPGRRVMEPSTEAWFRAREHELFLPAVTIAETYKGITKLRRTGALSRAETFEAWLDGLETAFGNRVLALDARIARLLGRMSDAAEAKGSNPGFADVAIAATAKQHGLTVLTRNLKHFEPLGIAFLDPFVGIS